MAGDEDFRIDNYTLFTKFEEVTQRANELGMSNIIMKKESLALKSHNDKLAKENAELKKEIAQLKAALRAEKQKVERELVREDFLNRNNFAKIVAQNIRQSEDSAKWKELVEELISEIEECVILLKES